MNTIIPKHLPCFSSLIAANEGCDNHPIISPSSTELVQHCCRAGLNKKEVKITLSCDCIFGDINLWLVKTETVTFGIFFFLNFQKFETKIYNWHCKHYFKVTFLTSGLFYFFLRSHTLLFRVIRSVSFLSWLFYHNCMIQSVLYHRNCQIFLYIYSVYSGFVKLL